MKNIVVRVSREIVKLRFISNEKKSGVEETEFLKLQLSCTKCEDHHTKGRISL